MEATSYATLSNKTSDARRASCILERTLPHSRRLLAQPKGAQGMQTIITRLGWLAMSVPALLVLTAACGGSSSPAVTSTGGPNTATGTSAIVTSAPSLTGGGPQAAPVGLIAIGHSGLTGENSDLSKPRIDAPENSWATGTAPGLNSIYQRLVAVRPETAGHVANFAEGGSRASALAGQASAALHKVPAPALVIIQTIDNDIRCDGSDDARIADFGKAVASALDVITSASPASTILVMSQPGRPENDVAAVAADPALKDRLKPGMGICDTLNPAGAFVPEHIATLRSILEKYEAEQSRACAHVPQCRDDGGEAATNYTTFLADASDDSAHLTVQGLARLAETMWPVGVRVLELQ